MTQTIRIFIHDGEPDDNLAILAQASKANPNIIICAAGKYPDIKVKHTQLIYDAILEKNPTLVKPEIIPGTASNKWGQITEIEGIESNTPPIDKAMFETNPIPLTISTQAFTALINAFITNRNNKIHITVTTEFTDLLLAINFAKNPLETKAKIVNYSDKHVEKAPYYEKLINQMNTFITQGVNTPIDLKNIELFYTGAANLSASHNALSKQTLEALKEPSTPWELTSLFDTDEYRSQLQDGVDANTAYYSAVTKGFNNLLNSMTVRGYENFGSTDGLNSTLQFFPELAAFIDDEAKNKNKAILNYLKHAAAWDKRGMKDDYPDLRAALLGLATFLNIDNKTMDAALLEFDAIQQGYLTGVNKVPANEVDAKIKAILKQLGIVLNDKYQPVINKEPSPAEKDTVEKLINKFNNNFNAISNILKGPQACLADILGVLTEIQYGLGKLPKHTCQTFSVAWNPNTKYPVYTPNPDGNLVFYKLAKPKQNNPNALFSTRDAIKLWGETIYNPLFNLLKSSIVFARGEKLQLTDTTTSEFSSL